VPPTYARTVEDQVLLILGRKSLPKGKGTIDRLALTSSAKVLLIDYAGNTKGGSITVLLTSCLTGLESAV